MYDNNSKGISYTAGFFMLIGFAIAGLLLASVISIPVWTSMTGKSIKEMETAMTDPANSNAMKVIQCITGDCWFFYSGYFYGLFTEPETDEIDWLLWEDQLEAGWFGICHHDCGLICFRISFVCK